MGGRNVSVEEAQSDEGKKLTGQNCYTSSFSACHAFTYLFLTLYE